jgi:DNA-binding NtrC family response regulator
MVSGGFFYILGNMSTLDILIVEDDRSLAYTLAAGLRQKLGEAIRVDTCFRASEALARLTQDSFDLVISDYQMPGMSGLEMLNQIHHHHPETILILITAYGTDELEKKAHDIVDAFMPKPFELADLILIIQGLLAGTKEDGKAHRVLLLEDETYLRRLFSKVLSKKGYQIVEAATMRVARELLLSRKFDVLICDIRLGDGLGIDLLREHLETLTRNGTKVIIVTGEARFHHLEDDLGIDLYLEKPVSIETLVTLVERLSPLPKEKI